MFAVLLSDKMDPFYQNILSFPTLFFTVILIFCVLFWLVAILGFLDISFLDHSGHDVHFGGEGDSPSTPDAVAGIILRMGLDGIPLTIIISSIALFGWLISYYIVSFTFAYVPGGIVHYLVGTVVLFISLFCSTIFTSWIVKPLRPLLKKMDQDVEKMVMGQTAIVRTSRVDQDFGEAILEDGGAGLILKVRSTGDITYKQGDKVVLIEYIKETNVFRVVSESEFNGI